MLSGNQKLEIILSQINTSQNSIRKIDNIYNDFQFLASIITERFDNFQINELNNYPREETTKNKADESLTSL